MKYPENILDVAALLPDYMGFIFSEISPRYFQDVIPEIPKSIKKTGVFVNENIEDILRTVVIHNLSAVQLHGNQSADFCNSLRKSLSSNVEIIKVFSIGKEFDFKIVEPFEACCDYYLFDTKGKFAGGNGILFNWDIFKTYNSKKPFFLSGGIKNDQLENIKKIIETDLPIYGIDLNSKFEIKPGLKNCEMLKDFITEIS